MKRLLLMSTALIALAAPASADTVTTFGGIDWTINANTTELKLVATPPPGNQVDNIPCVICGTNQPQQFQDFGFNNFKATGNETTLTAFSDATATHGGVALDNDTQGTAYSATFLRAFALSQLGQGADFNIGIDVNTAKGKTPEVLERFAVLDTANHVVLAFFNTPTALSVPNNGTGFPDMFLTGFDINRGDICGGMLINCSVPQIEFVAQWSNMSDGAESFFLVPAPALAVPGPVLGAGLPGIVAGCLTLLGLARQRRKQTA